MVTTYTKFLIKVKDTASKSTIGQRCKVTNLEGKGTITGEFRTGDECVLNPANSNKEWAIGDKLMVEISGIAVGSKQVTLTKGGIQVNIPTDTEDVIAVDL